MRTRASGRHPTEAATTVHQAGAAPITVSALLRLGAARLRASGIDSPETDAALLLSHLCECTRTQLRLRAADTVTDDLAERYGALLDRRAGREPLAYILGTQEFMGLTLRVDRRVLIPRPETEVLVEAVCERLRGVREPLVADIGTGSGAIAVAIAHGLAHAVVHGSDVSADALEVARMNAVEHGVGERVVLHHGDLLESLRGLGLEGQLAAVVSNPPYVAEHEREALQPEITVFEPEGALFAGPDGLVFHWRIIDGAREFLSPGCLLALEVGIAQARAVAERMRKAGYSGVERIRDLSGTERVVVGRWSP